MGNSRSSRCRNTTPSKVLRHCHTVGDALSTATHLLEAAGIESPRRTAELLLRHVLGWKQIELLLRRAEPLPPQARQQLARLLHRRLRHEPLQYVLRETEFYGLPIHVRRGVFIPRPETELLVDEALAILPADMPARILDIGTGSGCIALAIAAHRPRARVIGIDISATALRVARSNARRLGIRNVRFAYCDILHSLPPEAPFDLVVCNPPYIPAAEVPHLQPEVCLFEPYEALTDGGDGLLFYRRLAELVPFLLHPQGSLILELADGAAAAVVPLFQNRLRALRLRADYAGVQRVLIGAVDLSA